jgi:hypothetical protein
MAVRLDREVTLRLFYYTYQAWRSLHKALGAPWTEFRSFYAEHTAEALQTLRRDLRGRITSSRQPGTILGRLLDRCLPRRWQKWCVFHYLEAYYLDFVLEAFMEVLERPEKPPTFDYLISLRMALTSCSSILEQRCGADAYIDSQEQIEHFYRVDWVRPLTFEDLLQRSGMAVPSRDRQQVGLRRASADRP